ncbi:hypothetical protein [Granulicoccus sp. GXG6511]|uniref:hypothetical protein n=1 Tax=Granulicoccus sp. GXG6511 TaxID=3381351 RepID=UPI003D7D9023
MQRFQDFLANGVTPSEVRRQVKAGELIKLRRGAFADPNRLATPEDLHVELIAATLSEVSPHSVLSHTSAAVLHGLPVPLDQLKKVHVTRTGTGCGRAGTHTHRHTAKLPDGATVEVRGWAATSVPRTVVGGDVGSPHGGGLCTPAAVRRRRRSRRRRTPTGH